MLPELLLAGATLLLLLAAPILALALQARRELPAASERRRQEQLLAWLERQLPPPPNPERTRCRATNYATWGQWYAEQRTVGFPRHYDLYLGDYLDGKIDVDELTRELRRLDDDHELTHGAELTPAP